VLFTAMAGITEARFRLREGGMVYLLPFMIYPAALALSGVVTLVRWSWRRLGDDQGATATTRADQGQ
jgi:hypothetical protein